MESEVSLEGLINPTPKQREYLSAIFSYDYVFYGGAAGGGKSYILRWGLIYFLLRVFMEFGARNVRVGLFCEDYPSLHDRHLSKLRLEVPDWLGTFNEGRRELTLAREYGGGVVCFRNLDDPKKYMSVEFAMISVDELTLNKRAVFDDLDTRLRWSGLEHCPFSGAGNPQGIGLGWVKKFFIDRDFSDESEDLDPSRVTFIQARVEDNPHVSPRYAAKLKSKPDAIRRALLEGDWNVFEGQFFKEWRHHLHVVKPFDVPKDWPRWCGIDYGTAKPWACLWLTRDPHTGRQYVYREAYGAGLTAREQAERIVQYSANEWIHRYLADPSMLRRSNDVGTSPADTYQANGIVLTPAANNRVQGWNALRELLQVREDGLPGLQVFETCVNLCRTLPMQIHDEINAEDLDSAGEDHAVDALRYGCSSDLQVVRQAAKRPRRNPWASMRVAGRGRYA